MSVAVEFSNDVFHARSNNRDPASSSDDSSDDNESEGGWSDDDWVSTESEESSDEEAQSLSTISSHDSSSHNEQRRTEVQFPQNLDFRNDWNMSMPAGDLHHHEQGGASPLHRMSYHERTAGGKQHSIADLIGVPERNTAVSGGLGSERDAMAFIDRRIGQNHMMKDASKRFNFNQSYSGGGDLRGKDDHDHHGATHQHSHAARVHKQDDAFERDLSGTASNTSSGMEDSWRADLAMLKKYNQGNEKVDLEGSMRMNDIKLARKKTNEDEEWGELSELSDTSLYADDNNAALAKNSNYNQETGFFDWDKARHMKKGKAGHKKKDTNGVLHSSTEDGFYDWAKETRKKAKSRNNGSHSHKSAAGHDQGAQHDGKETPNDGDESYFDWETKQRKVTRQSSHNGKHHGKKKGH